MLVFAAYATVLALFSRRSEVVGVMSGQATDERTRSIEQRATAVTGNVLILVLVGCFVVSLAVGSQYTSVFSALCAVAGATWIAALVVLSRRG